MEQVDVVVIGAGAMGSAAAWQLARRGRTVALVEQFSPFHTNGSSHGGVRIFRFAYDDVHYVRMAQLALPQWRELEDDAGNVLLEQTGAIDHGATETVSLIADALMAAGAPFESLAPDAAHERFQGLRFTTRAVFHPDGGRVFARRFLETSYRRVAELGGTVRFSCPAEIAHIADDGVVINLSPSDGEAQQLRARTVVVTAGNWVGRVLRSAAGVTLPSLAIDHERVLHFRPIETSHSWPSFLHHVDPWRYGLMTPGEGLKIGGLREPIGSTAADGRPLPVDAVDPANLDKARRHAEEWVPGVDPEPIIGPTCSFTSTSNRDFILDRVGPVVVGSPCSDHGFKFAPFIGSVLADLATDRVPTFDISRHRLNAFAR
jgi:sarcosine oxidase